MDIEIRLAHADDAAGIAAVQAATWPDESGNTRRIADLLRRTERVTVVAVVQDEIVGFVDGFMTLAQNGLRRWEVDLLAVHPAYRGHGLASRLIAAHMVTGRAQKASLARALIRTDNLASERTFARCGFASDEQIYQLYVSSGQGGTNHQASTGLHLIQVETFGYSGLWLEGDLTLNDFHAAEARRQALKLDVVGVVLPAGTVSIEAAQSAGYNYIADFRWWRLKFAP